MKAAWERIHEASGEERKALIEDFERERQEFAKAQKAERKTQEAAMAGPDRRADVSEMPPAMRVLKEKAEQRKREAEDLKAALREASPQEKKPLLDAWRKKQEAAQTADMQQLETNARP